ncbi:MAG: hypothetical protein Q7W16_01090 [Coriobacteriia bacterium]|nr:hypothetical protein [Coriobacteriia bacterium]
MSTHIRANTPQEDGWAIPVVIMITAFVTLLSVTGFAMSSQVLRESVVVQDESRAFQAANAGIDAAMARLPGGQTGTYTVGASELGTGTTAVVNVKAVPPCSYRVTSTGYAVRGNQVTNETIQTEFTRFDLYDMNVSAGSSGDMISTGAIKGNSAIYGPYYTGAGIATARFAGGPLFVGGNVTGGSFSGIANAYVGGTGGSSIGATTLSSSVPKLPPLPVIDVAMMQGWQELARAQSIDNKMGDTTSVNTETDNTKTPASYYTVVSGRKSYATMKGWSAATYPYYKYIGPSTGMSALGAGTTHLTITDSTASFGKVTSTGYDDLAWDNATNILYVNGTVFVDGNVSISGATIMYKGNGTIVANGTIHIACTVFGPFSGLSTAYVDGQNWDHQAFPADQVLGFVSPTEIHLTGGNGNSQKARGDDPDIAGAFYCPAQIRFEKNILVAGSVITNTMVGPGNGQNVHLRNSPNLKMVAPQSMPGRNDGLMGYTKWIRK